MANSYRIKTIEGKITFSLDGKAKYGWVVPIWETKTTTIRRGYEAPPEEISKTVFAGYHETESPSKQLPGEIPRFVCTDKVWYDTVTGVGYLSGTTPIIGLDGKPIKAWNI